ncbi:MAG TPA: 50S ribosomal protein L3 N(5)-glutamine methyltransferase [Burkholderiales bacterium]|nr:50S ribosomal protein L3 N(5)-glutamine methyltransferase [Burkholderiales bacterium]
MTPAALIRDAARRFRAARLHYGHGTDNARDEAAFLVLRGLGLGFDASLDGDLPFEKQRRIESLIRRRIKERIPAAYLLNEAWLAGHPFYVDRRAIVPRSHIAGLLPGLGPAKRILDLCTGSGCLAILAALAFPRAQVDAADISAPALAVAARNVARYKLKKRLRLIRSDLFEALEGRYDLIIANPPYVDRRAMHALPAEYRYEPGLALAGGKDGLGVVKRIIAQAPRHLAPGGVLVCEVGDGRRRVERARPALQLLWPQDEVFMLEAPRTGAASRTPPRRREAR